MQAKELDEILKILEKYLSEGWLGKYFYCNGYLYVFDGTKYRKIAIDVGDDKNYE